ncbi:hypothetical protein DFH06DRAFT_188703 [Mycena polygramma]|nr:hypothetical protein DFH06DRAFT_188703 [Mycena polygramma]
MTTPTSSQTSALALSSCATSVTSSRCFPVTPSPTFAVSCAPSVTPSGCFVITPTSSSTSAVPLPSGCVPSDFPGLDKISPGLAKSSFTGCIVGAASTLQICCPRVNSTGAFVNGTCGCPILPDKFSTFLDCVKGQVDGFDCVIAQSAAITLRGGASLKWTAVVLGLGVAFVTTATGAHL